MLSSPKRSFRSLDRLALAATLMSSPHAWAATQAEAIAKVDATIAISSRTGTLSLAIPSGIKLNPDAPWKWELSGPVVDKCGAPSSLNKSALNSESATLTTHFPKEISDADVRNSRWTLIYFLCNKANTWCKRLTAQGSFSPIP
jgi:hypothetical protein